MLNRQLRLSGIPDQIPPAIREALVTTAGNFFVPDDTAFQGNLTPGDVERIMADHNLDPEERSKRVELMIALSKITQWGDWNVESINTIAGWIHALDYEQAKRRVEEEARKRDEQTKTPEALLWKSTKFLFQTALVAALIAIVQFLVKYLMGSK